MIEKLLKLYHNETMSVHMSRDKLYAILRKRYYWPGMFDDCNRWVNGCIVCRRAKTPRQLNHGLLRPIVSRYPFYILSGDISGPFTKTADGYEYIIVFIDLFSSWVEAKPLKSTSAEELCRVFFELIISRHGCPIKILTDNGSNMTSKAFNKICRQFNIEHIESTSYHHEANGKSEKFIQYLETSIKTIMAKDQSNWDKLIDNVLMSLSSIAKQDAQRITVLFDLWARCGTTSRLVSERATTS